MSNQFSVICDLCISEENETPDKGVHSFVCKNCGKTFWLCESHSIYADFTRKLKCHDCRQVEWDKEWRAKIAAEACAKTLAKPTSGPWEITEQYDYDEYDNTRKCVSNGHFWFYTEGLGMEQEAEWLCNLLNRLASGIKIMVKLEDLNAITLSNSITGQA